MTRTDRLERQSERSRERVADLIDELRERVVPSEMVDQFIDLSGNGAARDFVVGLGQQVRRNPLPMVLIGAGLAWLIFAERNNLTASLAKNSPAQRMSGGRRGKGRRRAGAGRKRGRRQPSAAA
jgi:hypothetical protein